MLPLDFIHFCHTQLFMTSICSGGFIFPDPQLNQDTNLEVSFSAFLFLSCRILLSLCAQQLQSNKKTRLQL